MDKNPKKIRETFASIASKYDLANHLLSGFIHKWWKKKLINTLLKNKNHTSLIQTGIN
ncbi:MAG: hypothetical protein D6780_07860 [Candidatus Dadabacteria bacterium]|nr:MAG: hypothetical protein D6780_07860 [Candidatus Dadabacteria bacterium]